MTAVSSERVAHLICEALGLEDRKVVAITLELRVARAVKVTVEEYPTEEHVEAVANVVRHYELHERSEDETP